MTAVRLCSVPLFFITLSKLADGSGYKGWYSSARNSYSRGKATYDSLFKTALEREEECAILSPVGGRPASFSDAGDPAVRGVPDASQMETFPCLSQLQHIDPKAGFQINADVAEIAGGSRHERVLAEGGCWQYVLNAVHALDVGKCDVKGEIARSLIALAKTKCHFIRSGRAFPLAEHGCILNPEAVDDDSLGLLGDHYASNPCKNNRDTELCESLKADIVAQCTNPRIMSESAFQMYHADLNHIDDICFYLQSSEWNRRTESNINKLGESASNLVESQKNMAEFLDNFQERQEESIQKANRLNNWMDSLQSDLRDVFNILEIISSYQRKIFDFIHNFKLFFMYALYAAVAIAITVFEATAWARPRIVMAVATACITDSLAYKACMRLPQLEEYGFDQFVVYSRVSVTIKWVAGLYSVRTWFKALVSYQPPAQAMLKEMHQIRKILTPRIVYPGFGTESDDECSTDTEEYRPTGYTLDQFVDLFCENSDSTYVYETGYTSDESYSESLGEDSEGLVEEYNESLARRRRNAFKARRILNYRQL